MTRRISCSGRLWILSGPRPVHLGGLFAVGRCSLPAGDFRTSRVPYTLQTLLVHLSGHFSGRGTAVSNSRT